MYHSDPATPVGARRKALTASIAALLVESGFGGAEESALETLVEMAQSYLTELGRSTRAYSELSGRTEPLLSDVVMAMIEMGADVAGLPEYWKKSNKTAFIPPVQLAPPPNPKALQAGQKQQHPSHIPEHLPPFPDPHTYIRTPTLKQPCNDYQTIREKASSQKRDVERALTKFIAKTGDTHLLFKEEPSAFPLIACQKRPQPYLDALLPKEEDLESADSTPSGPKPPKVLKQKSLLDSPAAGQSLPQTPQDSSDNDLAIDNPYVRPVKMPKVKKKIIKYW